MKTKEITMVVMVPETFTITVARSEETDDEFSVININQSNYAISEDEMFEYFDNDNWAEWTKEVNSDEE